LCLGYYSLKRHEPPLLFSHHSYRVSKQQLSLIHIITGVSGLGKKEESVEREEENSTWDLLFFKNALKTSLTSFVTYIMKHEAWQE
jgi:hypothetical protein